MSASGPSGPLVFILPQHAKSQYNIEGILCSRLSATRNGRQSVHLNRKGNPGACNVKLFFSSPGLEVIKKLLFQKFKMLIT